MLNSKDQQYDRNEDELEEERYMKEGKLGIQMRKVFLQKIQKVVEEQKKLVQRTRKKNTQAIDLFERKELNFLSDFILNSNNAIFDGERTLKELS